MAELSVSVNSHHFVVRKLSPRARGAVESFARKYIEYKPTRTRDNRYTTSATKVYAFATAARTEYRFHINVFDLFLEHLNADYIRGNMIEVVYNKPPKAVVVELPIKAKWTDRDHQPPIIEYMATNEEQRSKLVSLRTGKGKTYCALKAISKIGLRFLIVVKPKYVEKWIEDVHKTYDINPEDLIVVRGSEQLQALLMLASAGELTAKCIIISNRTLQNWISFYKLHGMYSLELGYDCIPEMLCEHLQVGVRLIDEVHEDFHFNFILDLHTNVYRSISLSATLTSYDPFLENMYSIAYPHPQRYEGPAFDNYVISRAVFYRFRNLNKVRWKDPATKNYSHHVLESCILRDQEMATNYFRMHEAMFRELYLKKERVVKRCLIFATSIAMCTALTSYFQKRFPTLDVRRYVEDDPYVNLMEAEVSISTILSAGTGHDIPDLVTVIRGTMLLSKQGNIQGFGRLRELFDGTQPEYAYLVCTDISKHMDYHIRTEELLKRDSAVYRTDTYGDRI